jgi:ketosteroid isomerase-like protein
MAQDALSVVQEVYGAFGRGDIPAILGKLTPDVVWAVEGREGAYPTFGTRHGPNGALSFFVALGETEDITAFEPQTFHPSGDTVLVQGRIGVKLRNNGKALDYDWTHIFTVRDGKVAAFKELYDTAMVVEAYRT